MSEDVARSLRSAGLKVITPLAADGFGTQLKLATKHGARFVVLLGESERAAGQVLVKNLATGEQSAVGLGDVAGHIQRAKA